MKIHSNFIGGNIIVESIENEVVKIKCDQRDSSEDWFYWAFCVEGAAGKTLTFKFPKDRIGYFGPAISQDLKKWDWLNKKDDYSSFTYTFNSDEDKVYFAHSLLYHPNRFNSFVNKYNIKTKCLCKSKKGREIPMITFGNGDIKILLTARHHACESTGNYVLEGVLKGLLTAKNNNISVFCVPFVDYDGVVDGDQGKSRIPHDHNRDYEPDKKSIYPEINAIRSYIDNNDVLLGFDFHSPWHIGGVNDNAFIVQKSLSKTAELNLFGELLEKNNRSCSFNYKHENDAKPDVDWNHIGAPTFATYLMNKKSNKVAFTLETAYFGTEENKAGEEKFINLGIDFANTILEYIN